MESNKNLANNELRKTWDELAHKTVQ